MKTAVVATKKSNYSSHLAELRAEGIEYMPVIWSAYGRPHPDAIRLLVTLSRNTARRRGTRDAASLARRSAARVAAALWKRAAGMVVACWPVSAGSTGASQPEWL